MRATGVLLCLCAASSFARTNPINAVLRMRNTKAMASTSHPSELIESVALGTKQAMQHCKDVFRWDRWNCPDSAFSSRYKRPFSRETAFVQAVLAAGVVHSVTRNCSRGELPGCGCGEGVAAGEGDGNWTWGRCSDSTAFAEGVAKGLLESLEGGDDAQAHSAAHNSQVGRKMVRESMVRQCRCHGISGSCSLKTCWMQLAPLQEVAMELKERYRKAVRVNFEDGPEGLAIGNSAKEVSAERFRRIDPGTLVYLEESPDYCRADVATGWTGTKGRTCSRSKTEPSAKKSCKNICRSCGHRVRKQKKEVSFRCNCTFTWCCEVKCEVCTKTVETHYCG